VRNFLGTALDLVKQTFKEYSADKAPRLGAALSYYTVFSLAPVLVLVISIAGLVFGNDAARGQIVGELQGLVGREAAEVVQTMLAKASDRGSGILSTVIGFLMLLVGATGVLIELQAAINTVWKVAPKPGGGLKALLHERLLSFGLILAFGFILLVSLVLSALLAGIGGMLSRFIPGWVVFAYVLNYAVALGVMTALMAMIYKILPDVRIAWRDVWVGALVTSILFQVGKFAIGMYVGKASVGSPFGAAGSLAVLLVWVYYSSQILLLGAEFTRVSALKRGARVEPTDHAVLISGPAPSEGPIAGSKPPSPPSALAPSR
jgi:membrane protein